VRRVEEGGGMGGDQMKARQAGSRRLARASGWEGLEAKATE
jgi:hypothetical protein